MTSWTKLQLSTAAPNAEVCAQLLLDAGCSGAQIDDCAVLLDESEDATIARRAEAKISGFVPSDAAKNAAEKLQHFLQRGEVEAALEIEAVPDENWETSWRENFPPLEIGPFLIAPSWENIQAKNGEMLLRLDPGLAFGTGQHPTTKMCLELLAEVLAKDNSQSLQLFDIGCGSGILSVAAAKLGAKVTASDLDPFCVAATLENARENDVQIKVVQEAGAAWPRQKFDLVIANLMSDLLISLAPELFEATKTGGTLIVSGISAPRAAEVESALGNAGFTTIEKREENGDVRGDFVECWAAFVMGKVEG